MAFEDRTGKQPLCKAAWAQMQQFEALLQQPHPEPPSAPSQQQELDADAGIFVAMTHCLGLLCTNLTTGMMEYWQPGRRDYRLLANMMLRGLRRTEAGVHGSSAWTMLLPRLTLLFGSSWVFPERSLKLTDTAVPAAEALVSAGQRLLVGPPLAGSADTLGAFGAGAAVAVLNLIAHILTVATVTLDQLR